MYTQRMFAMLLVLSTILCFPGTIEADDSFTAYVDPFIGTASAQTSDFSGNTYPGAQVPWGMVSISPHTRRGYPAGYVHGDPFILGFGQNHRSGGGCGDLGNFLLMPTQSNSELTEETYRSTYDQGQAAVGFYSVHLSKYNIDALMTATTRTSLSQYIFHNRNINGRILLDISHGIQNKDELGSIKFVSTNELEGSRLTGSHCGSPNQQPVYFVAQFSQPAISVGTWVGTTASNKQEVHGNDIGGFADFSLKDSDAVLVKVGISYVSIENARANLQAEQPGFDFEKTKQAAQSAWNTQLGKISVTSESEKDKKVFYTALYHSLLQPNIINDVTGEYPAADGRGIKKTDRREQYTVIPTWDQFRTLHPLLTLVYPKQELDIVRSMISIIEDTGWPPKWELAAWDNRSLTGDHAAAIVSGAYLKGLTDFNVQTAYDILRKSATNTDSPNRPGLKEYLDHGYIPEPTSTVYGSVATTLEYSYDDWALALLADKLGKKSDAHMFRKRAENYKNLYDEETKLLRPRHADGSFLTPFDPGAGPQFPGPTGYVEGNAYNYSFFPIWDSPQGGLPALMGKESFIQKLAETLASSSYTLNNEPDSTTAYGFTYLDHEAWRTQKQVRNDLQRFTDQPNGIPGNDDEGSLSSVYIFNALGFFPVDPAGSTYQIGSPLFNKVIINLDTDFYFGDTLTLTTSNNTDKSPYIKSATLNNTEFNRTTLTHEELTVGSILDFSMTTEPTDWGVSVNYFTTNTINKGGLMNFLAYEGTIALVALIIVFLVYLYQKRKNR